MDLNELALALGALVPLLVALITKRYAQPWVKVAVNLVGSTLAGALAWLVAADGHLDLAGFGWAFVEALASSTIAYAAAWKHTAVRAIEAVTGSWGLGTEVLTPLEPAAGAVVVDSQGAVVSQLPTGPAAVPDRLDGL